MVTRLALLVTDRKANTLDNMNVTQYQAESTYFFVCLHWVTYQTSVNQVLAEFGRVTNILCFEELFYTFFSILLSSEIKELTVNAGVYE